MVHRVPDGVLNEDAALLDPFTSALHPVLEYPPVEGDRVLVLGAGIIGLCTIAALRAVRPKCEIWVAARYSHQAEMARHLGADYVFGRDDDLYRKAADLIGSPLFKPTLGKRILLNGVDLVYDCVGSAASIDDALRLLRPKGRLVLIGTASVLKVDWSFVWFKELSVHGALMYESHHWNGTRQSTYKIALSLLERRAVRLAPLLTKTYPLEAYREAILAAADKASSGAIKVAFRPTS
jgi:threonine dehydrogenase-like Zn-dependent dehydrogenase